MFAKIILNFILNDRVTTDVWTLHANIIKCSALFVIGIGNMLFEEDIL